MTKPKSICQAERTLPGRAPSRGRVVMILSGFAWFVCTTLTAGCTASFGPRTRTDGTGPATVLRGEDNPFLVTLAPATPTAGPLTQPRRMVQFEVIQVQWPLDELDGLKKIWNHLDETAVGIETQILLQRNGFRVGLGGPESWPPIRAILQTVEDRIVRHPPPSLPNSLCVSLELKSRRQEQDIFFYRPDGTLAGQSFGSATDLLRITWQFDRNDARRIVVFITPEVREERTGVTYKPTPTGIAVVPKYKGRIFRELACRISVRPEHYIIIGPSDMVADRAGLIGRQFLVSDIDGKQYVTLLVLAPRIIQPSDGKTAPQQVAQARKPQARPLGNYQRPETSSAPK